jgi:hypothetical protein
MSSIVFLYTGALDPDEYSDWKEIVVEKKSRTPQGSFYVESGDKEYVVALSYEMTREFWYQVRVFETIEARVADRKWLAAIRFRGKDMYSVEEFEEAGQKRREKLINQMKYVSVAFVFILALLKIKERR